MTRAAAKELRRGFLTYGWREEGQSPGWLGGGRVERTDGALLLARRSVNVRHTWLNGF